MTKTKAGQLDAGVLSLIAGMRAQIEQADAQKRIIAEVSADREAESARQRREAADADYRERTRIPSVPGFPVARISKD